MDIEKKLSELERRIEAIETKKQPHSREVEMIDLETGKVLARYPSMAVARKKSGVDNISHAAHGHLRHAGGYGWRFTEEAKLKGPGSPGRPVKCLADIDILAAYVRANPGCFAFEAKKALFDNDPSRMERAMRNAAERGLIVRTVRGKFVTLAPAAPLPPTEKSQHHRPIGRPAMVMPKNRASPRWYPQPTQADVFLVLDMALEGKTNHVIAEATGLSPGMCGRLRGRSKWVSNYWDFVDAWLKEHPGVVVMSERQAKRNKR